MLKKEIKWDMTLDHKSISKVYQRSGYSSSSYNLPSMKKSQELKKQELNMILLLDQDMMQF
jgi:hypothetical protein